MRALRHARLVGKFSPFPPCDFSTRRGNVRKDERRLENACLISIGGWVDFTGCDGGDHLIPHGKALNQRGEVKGSKPIGVALASNVFGPFSPLCFMHIVGTMHGKWWLAQTFTSKFIAPYHFILLSLSGVVVSLGSGPWDQLLGGENSPSLAVAAVAAFSSGLIAILALPRSRSEKHRTAVVHV
ncbi:Sucrose transport protein SUC4-like protein [Drosera capensis]